MTGKAVREGEFGSGWYVWHSDRWRASSKPLFCWGYTAETADGLREQLDSVMTAAIPELRARLEAAVAASERLKAQSLRETALQDPGPLGS